MSRFFMVKIPFLVIKSQNDYYYYNYIVLTRQKKMYDLCQGGK